MGKHLAGLDNLAHQLDEDQNTRSEQAVQFCEDHGLGLRLSCAVMAIVDGHRTNQPGRFLEATHWIEKHLQHRGIEVPEGVVDAVRRIAKTGVKAGRPRKPGKKARASVARVSGKAAVAVPAKPVQPVEKGTPERPRRAWGFKAKADTATAGRGKKFCSHCGEARGVRAFINGSTQCNTCATGAKPEPMRPRARTMAEAETE
jgi:hypothetical protein